MRTRGRSGGLDRRAALACAIAGAGVLAAVVAGVVTWSGTAPPEVTQSAAHQLPAVHASAPAWARPLAGAVVVIDPGHDGGNGRHPDQINRLVPTPVGPRPCDTAGTETDAGYPEHAFTWDLAQRLTQTLTAAGAHVVLTRETDDGVGPCTAQRAQIGNAAAASAPPGVPVLALSLHADGGPASGSGFHVIEPGPSGRNDAVVGASERLGAAVRDAFRAGTGEPYASYIPNREGIVVRTDLGGLNLTTVPKVFIECGNMRNAEDAARLIDPAWRQRAADALTRGLADAISPSLK